MAPASSELPLDRDDVVSNMETLFDIRARVDGDPVLLEEEGDGEEEE